MKLILTEDVENLGFAGDLVEVKDGYGRNYLVPQAKAVFATPGAIRHYENLRKDAEQKAALTVENAKELAEKIENTSLTISATVGEDDKIFGTVTNAQIADALEQRGMIVDRRKISLDQDIKTLGEYTATIQLVADIKPQVKIMVVKEEN